MAFCRLVSIVFFGFNVICMGVINLDLEAIESYVANHLRLFLSMAAGLLVFVGIVAATVFFINVRGTERTMVPDVIGQDLTAALLELQVKELYPRINLRYSQSSADKGLILEQNPQPGTIVKAGRRIQLVVSQGVMVNTIENYVGRNLDEVRMDLQTLTASQGTGTDLPRITIKEPLMFIFSIEPAGTVLQQRPEPGTAYSGTTALELIVSRGSENTMTNVPALIGLSLEDALEQIGRAGIDFEFSLRQGQTGETPGTVVSQNPPADTIVASSTRVALVYAAPEKLPENQVLGLFTYDMAKNPYPLLITLDSVLPGGTRQRLLSVQYPGGRLTVPYIQPAGSVLVLSMLNREIHRETVSLLAEALLPPWF